MVSLGMLAGRGFRLLRNVRLKGCDDDVWKREVVLLILLMLGREDVQHSVNGNGGVVKNNEWTLRCSAEVYLYVIFEAKMRNGDVSGNRVAYTSDYILARHTPYLARTINFQSPRLLALEKRFYVRSSKSRGLPRALTFRASMDRVVILMERGFMLSSAKRDRKSVV